MGDVSWVVPVTGFTTACWVPGTPGHSWQAVACGGTTIGKKGMNLAARTLAATAYDLFTDPKLLKAAKAEHAKRLDGRKYAAMLEKDQPPPLDYRNAGKARTKRIHPSRAEPQQREDEPSVDERPLCGEVELHYPTLLRHEARREDLFTNSSGPGAGFAQRFRPTRVSRLSAVAAVGIGHERVSVDQRGEVQGFRGRGANLRGG